MDLHNLNRWILDFFYPNRCPCCDTFITYSSYVCDDCIKKLKNQVVDLCEYCGFERKHCKCGSGTYYDRAFVCYPYEGTARDGVLSLKSGTCTNFAYHTGNILSNRIREQVIKYDVVIPIPMHYRKKNRRGYNQAEVLANVLSKNLNIPMDKNALKVKYTKHTQHSLNKAQRIINANKLYYQGTSDLRDKYVILVDDIMTTGSTLNVCSQILNGMGAKSVIIAVATSSQLKD